jgi:hypothetical protein
LFPKIKDKMPMKIYSVCVICDEYEYGLSAS